MSSGSDLLSQTRGWSERAHVRLMQWLLASPRLDAALRWCHWHLGAPWINLSSHGRRHAIGLERVPALAPEESVLLAANHLSYFDLFIVCSHLSATRGLRQRILFPVRSGFFYDNILGIIVNLLMSFFAMYPPVFRDRKRMAANLASLQEMVRLLSGPGVLLGIHPEGTRNKSDDPYTLLPAQPGVGRLVRRVGCKVLPVFVRGTGNSILREQWQTLRGRGRPVILAFGEPVALDDLLEAPDTSATATAITGRIMAAIARLGQEERAFRAALSDADQGTSAV